MESGIASDRTGCAGREKGDGDAAAGELRPSFDSATMFAKIS